MRGLTILAILSILTREGHELQTDSVSCTGLLVDPPLLSCSIPFQDFRISSAQFQLLVRVFPVFDRVSNGIVELVDWSDKKRQTLTFLVLVIVLSPYLFPFPISDRTTTWLLCSHLNSGGNPGNKIWSAICPLGATFRQPPTFHTTPKRKPNFQQFLSFFIIISFAKLKTQKSEVKARAVLNSSILSITQLLYSLRSWILMKKVMTIVMIGLIISF